MEPFLWDNLSWLWRFIGVFFLLRLFKTNPHTGTSTSMNTKHTSIVGFIKFRQEICSPMIWQNTHKTFMYVVLSLVRFHQMDTTNPLGQAKAKSTSLLACSLNHYSVKMGSIWSKLWLVQSEKGLDHGKDEWRHWLEVNFDPVHKSFETASILKLKGR